MTTVVVEEEVITVTNEVVDTITITVAEQGPPGPQGNNGFTTSVDVISGGTPTTDYTTGFIFSGGTP